MTFLSMLYSFFLMPIQLVFELVFIYAYYLIGLVFEQVFVYAYRLAGMRVGFAIIVLSLAFNLLVLPLYRRADAMQEEERDMEAKLHDGVAHIKKTFRGDERTMMLQTYYRQNDYSPLRVLRSAVSLLLQIPFFITAYRFLSGLSLLQGASFGPIKDFSLPDALISIGSFSINVLPIVMTAINVVTTIILTKGYPLKSKIQLYAIATLFLIFLYNSPSGLVFYWTLNNLFSLVKTIFYKLKNPKKALRIMLLIFGCCSVAFAVFCYVRSSSRRYIFAFVAFGLTLCIPFIYNIFRMKTSFKGMSVKTKPDKKLLPDNKLFWSTVCFLTVLVGILIPSAVVSASPQEFIVIGSDVHPVWYIVSALLIASGLFILWMGIFYWLFSSKAKVIMERILLVMCGVGIVDYLFFGKDLGTISADLIYHNGLYYDTKHVIKNFLILLAVTLIILLITKMKPVIMKAVVVVATVAMVCMTSISMFSVFSSVAQIDMNSLAASDGQPHITLNKNQKNVVVIMLDRAMGEYVPYIISEHPEIEEQFSGFTYYSNVISYGGHTVYGTPPLFGGYEYTPVEINKRDTETLKSKQNEALMVMPVLFDEAGYDVTVCDPPYAGYQEIPDLSIYDDYPDIKKYITQGTILEDDIRIQIINNRYRNFFCYAITRISPTCLQSTLYDGGQYNRVASNENFEFELYYSVLKQLPEITKIQDNGNGCFVMMQNDTTHTRATFTDNRYLEPVADGEPEQKHSSMTLDGITLHMDASIQNGTYQANVAALMRVGDWMDYLKEQGVYDNTRIIIVADHGFGTLQIDGFVLDETAYCNDIDQRVGDAEFYFPLLMVKDFDSSGFSISDEFMTNADVPSLATKDLMDSPKNPFTGKKINNSEKTAHDQLVIATAQNYLLNNTTFPSSRWYSVHDSIWDKKNWKLYAENDVIN